MLTAKSTSFFQEAEKVYYKAVRECNRTHELNFNYSKYLIRSSDHWDVRKVKKLKKNLEPSQVLQKQLTELIPDSFDTGNPYTRIFMRDRSRWFG